MTEEKVTIGKAQLMTLLKKFFKTYNKSWYNSKRIIAWGSQQAGFEVFNTIKLAELQTILKELASTNEIKSKKSDKGNWTLYRC
jgi:hypothetical protein